MPNYSPYSYQYPQYGYQMPQQQQQTQIPQQMPQPQLPQPQIQNGGFMSIPTEQDARNYPVAPGNVMTFKIENQPYVCEKAQGFSQLEGPVFNKYRLVKEDTSTPSNLTKNESSMNESTNTTLDIVINDIESIKEDIKSIKEKLKNIPKPMKKKEDEEDE